MSRKKKRPGQSVSRKAGRQTTPAPSKTPTPQDTAAAEAKPGLRRRALNALRPGRHPWGRDVPELGGAAPDRDYAVLAQSVIKDPVLRTVAQPAFALIMLLALLLFWRGHQLPGGGFVGGAMTVCALLLHRIATGHAPLKFDFARLIPVGLATAFVTGLVPYLTGRSFLKSDYGYLTTPVTGEFEWATALLFDLGVYLLVVGGGMAIAEALIDIHPTERVEEDL